MTREIKFRAWDKDDKVMWSHNVIETYAHTQGESAFDIITRNFSNMVLMQYTGLKDKNGREIYEGDIVKSEHYPIPSEIMFGEFLDDDKSELCSSVGFYWSDRNGAISFGRDTNGSSNTYEIIGNIYENPELLNI